MSSSAHISVETLADIADDCATAEAREVAICHIAECSTCDETLRRLQQLILMMKSDSTKDVPRDVLASAINIFSPQERLLLRRIVALLIFDSRTAGPAFGMRSLRASSRQLLYSAEEADLDLRITAQNEDCILAGQVICDGCTGGLVEISGATGTAEASLNELCEFTLPPIPVGNYSLTVRMLDREIEIPGLELKV